MAERITLTKKAIEAANLPTTGRAYLADAKVPGLLVQLTTTGSRSFQVYRKLNGKPVRVTLGRYPDMTIEQARKEASVALASLAVGVNPTDTKRTKKVMGTTLREVVNEYVKSRALKESTVGDMERVLREVIPDWVDLPITRITRDMVLRRHREYGKKSAARVNVAMRYLRAWITFAAARYLTSENEPIIERNPVAVLSETRAWHRVDRRKTLIRPHELGGWVNAVPDLPVGHRDYFMTLLLTGLRRNEAMNLTWVDVDLTGRTLTIRDPKNHNDHTLPLSDYLMDLFTRRKATALTNYVFTDESGRRVSNLRYAQDKIEKASGVKFTPHDLRRTFATIAESIDIPAYALKRLLNHADGADVTAGYLVVTHERLRDPMQRITDYVLKSAGLKPSADVIPIRRSDAM